jgi:hypothetical protein
LKDPAIAGLRFSLVGRIFTGWSSDQGIIEKVKKRKTKGNDIFAQNLVQNHAANRKDRERKSTLAMLHIQPLLLEP